MKKVKVIIIVIVIAFISIFIFQRLNRDFLLGYIIEKNKDSLLIKTSSNSDYRDSLAYIAIDDLKTDETAILKKGDNVKVFFDGRVADSYPLQINNVTSIERVKIGYRDDSIVKDSKNVVQVEIYQDDKLITTLNKGDKTDRLINVLNLATKQDGIVSMRNYDYRIIIQFDNNKKQNINVWVEAIEIATIMDEKDSHTIYTLTFEESSVLKSYLE